MRSTFLILLLSLGLGGVLLLKARHKDEPASTSASADPRAPLTTRARPVSEHNWPKNSLDRVGDLKRQVAQQRQENDPH